MTKMYHTGTIQKDIELTVRYSGIHISDILGVTDLYGNFEFQWEAFLNSISGVDYRKISEIANPLVIRTSSAVYHITDSGCTKYRCSEL